MEDRGDLSRYTALTRRLFKDKENEENLKILSFERIRGGNEDMTTEYDVPFSTVFYGTGHEIEFIQNIGMYSNDGKFKSKRVLLENYIAAARLRSNWGSVDSRRCIEYAVGLLVGLK